MDADLNRAASVRTRELADQDVLRPLDAARELGRADFRRAMSRSIVSAIVVVSTGYLLLGRAPGCSYTCGATSLFDTIIVT
jgi:hypothetical protein